MHPLITDLFKKRKINSVEDLSSEEKETFDKWERILSEGEITPEKMAEFCRNQLKIIDGKLSDLDNPPSGQKDSILKAALAIYSALLKIIEGPKAEKESLERYLKQLTE